MATIRFFDLLGVAGSLAAAELWPREHVQPTTGLLANGDDPQDFQGLMEYLQTALSFRALRPGAAPDQVNAAGEIIRAGKVGLSAEVVVKNPINPGKLVLSQMPDIAFILQDTPDPPDSSGYRPARLYVTQAETGVELVLEALPVEIQIPSTMLGPLEPAAGEPPLQADVPLTEPFRPGVHDSLAVMCWNTILSAINGTSSPASRSPWARPCRPALRAPLAI
jgi:hypothetical protein